MRKTSVTVPACATLLCAVLVAGGAHLAQAGINVLPTIDALAINPSTPSTLYVGTDGAGVFKSTDSGGSWIPASIGLTSNRVFTLAINPSTPSTLYAGTGCTRAGCRQAEVFKSTDSGRSWSPVNTGLPSTYVWALAIDRSQPSTLYAGTSGGLFKSTDSGTSWSPAATPAPGALSGTITYSGTRVLVSDSKPIIILLVAFDPDATLIDTAYVPVNGGAFVLHAPAAGNYYLLYSVDLHDYRDESVSVGAPFEVYDGRFAVSFPAPFPADPVSVPQAGLNLEFGDTALLSGIAGTVTYTGIQPVEPGDSLVVEAYSNPAFSGEPEAQYAWAQPDGRYELPGLATGTSHYVRAFVDLNQNSQRDAGEAFAGCRNSVVAGPDQTDVTITFGDAGAATCIVPASPTQTPTPPPSASVGDCDSSGDVTVDEIIILVNIDLGTADASACQNGIPSGVSVDITLIIQAVNNALTAP